MIITERTYINKVPFNCIKISIFGVCMYVFEGYKTIALYLYFIPIHVHVFSLFIYCR